jgi:hypothetical protein
MFTPSPSSSEAEPNPPPTYATIAKTHQLAVLAKIHHLRALLINTNTSSEPTPTIRASLLSPDPVLLPLKDLRNLFGSLRKALLQTLWELRQCDLWIKRARAMGVDYARGLDEDGTCGKYPNRYAFFREMDEGLEVGAGFYGSEGEKGREEVVGVMMRHVEALREAVEEVRGKKVVKGRMLRGGGGGVVVSE